MCQNLTLQVRSIAKVTTAVAHVGHGRVFWGKKVDGVDNITFRAISLEESRYLSKVRWLDSRQQ